MPMFWHNLYYIITIYIYWELLFCMVAVIGGTWRRERPDDVDRSRSVRSYPVDSGTRDGSRCGHFD